MSETRIGRYIIIALAVGLLAFGQVACVQTVSPNATGAEKKRPSGPAAGGDSGTYFSDSFAGKLGAGWRWLREDKKAWRIKDGGLEIRVQPGLAGTVKNALVREAPDRTKGPYTVDVTIANHTAPTNQYEQAGITWYHKGRPAMKFVKELVNGKVLIVPGLKPMGDKTVQLRLVVDGTKWTALYRPGGKGEFLTAAAGKLPAPGADEISIQCYNGPPNAEHWIRFDDFRITPLKK